MTNKIFYLLATLSSISCSDNTSQFIESQKVVFSGVIAPYATRISVENSNWDNNDSIGIYMYSNSKNILSTSKYTNIPYRYTAYTSSATFSSDTPIILSSDDGDVKFMAYYPYSSLLESSYYPISLYNQSDGISSSDLMTAISSTPYNVQQAVKTPAQLEFRHCLCKITIHFVDENNTGVQITNPWILGCYTEGTYNLNSHELTVDSNSTLPTSPHLINNGTAFEAILMPVTFNEQHKVTFNYQGKVYSWKLSSNKKQLKSFQSGHSYTFTLQVGKDTPTDIEGGGSSSSPWEDGEDIDDTVVIP